jgi:anti-sigma regulatory factor (Ser/Thr protein kinase)
MSGAFRRGLVFVRDRTGADCSPRKARRFELNGGVDAGKAARGVLDGLLRGVESPLYEDVRLLVTELVTNCVRHAGVGPDERLEVVVSVSGETLRVEVHDPGPGFDPRARPPRSTSDSGWGLVLVDRLADRWGVAREARTRVWFEIDRAKRWRSSVQGMDTRPAT